MIWGTLKQLPRIRGVKWKRLSRESAKVRERRDAFLKETGQKPGTPGLLFVRSMLSEESADPDTAAAVSEWRRRLVLRFQTT